MNCTSCGGQLVWDYERGEIVCSKCGLVQDRLSTLEVLEYRSNLVKDEDDSESRRHPGKYIVSREYKRYLRIYMIYYKMTKNKPWLEVDYSKITDDGRFVKTLRSRASMKAIKNIDEHGYWDLVKQGLNYISMVNPAYLARSERGKYALAYILASLLRTGHYPSRESVKEIFNISDASYRRLCNIARKILQMGMPNKPSLLVA